MKAGDRVKYQKTFKYNGKYHTIQGVGVIRQIEAGRAMLYYVDHEDCTHGWGSTGWYFESQLEVVSLPPGKGAK